MNKKIRTEICERIDGLLALVTAASKSDMIPQLQADEIVNGLLDARQATTAEAALDPEQVPA